MKQKPAKHKKTVRKKTAARRSSRKVKAPAKKTAKATQSPVKTTARSAKRPAKKTTRSARIAAKKTVKAAKSPAKKTAKATKSPVKKTARSSKRPAKKTTRSARIAAKKTVKAAKSPAKKTAKATKSPVKKTARSAKRPAKKTTRSARIAAQKTVKTAKSPAKKTSKASKSPVKAKAKSTKRPAKKTPRSTKLAPKKTVAIAKSPAKKAGKSSKSPAKKSVKSTKIAAKKAPKNAKPLKSAPAKKEPAAKSSDKALAKFDPLQRYLTEISSYKLLTREEEHELGIRVQEKGDKDAAFRLVTSNLRLVVKIALEFQRVWMQNLLDLIQEGNIGLMQAVKKFDPYKNVKFSYYASFWIKAYILKFIMDNWRLVKIGTTQGQRKLFFKLKKEKQKLIDEGFEPRPKLLSERLGVSEREIVDMDQRLDGWDVSLDAPLKEDSDTERIEFVSTDAESIEDKVSKKEIEVLLHNKIAEFRKKMTPRELEIFDLRIFSDNPVTLQEIGDRYGISRERVRQVEKNIIKKMREFFKREIPDFASYTEGSRAD